MSDGVLRCLCVAGPTAAGKTAAALAIADALPVEIVSVDSALVYRGMDIGTAKPSAAERAQAPHHLIDILDPAQSYSAAQFLADATRLIEEIRAALGDRSIVLVGMPGCGKSAAGKRLAPRLCLPFMDADTEIEKAAGKSIKDIFADHGNQIAAIHQPRR